MDVESVRSGRSERSDRSGRSHGNRHHRSRHGGSGERRDHYNGNSHSGSNSHHNGRRRSRDRHERGHGDTDRETDRDDRSVTISMPQGNRRPQQERRNGEHETEGEGEERIEVQIIPQEDVWPDNTTAITGNTSVTDFSMEDMNSRMTKDMENSIGFNCARYVGSILAGILGFLAFMSPIAMVILPKLGIKPDWTLDACNPACEGLIISFAFKLLILLIGSWALFFRKPKATMPRIFIFRALILFLVFVLIFSYWLFYGVRIYDTSEKDYQSIVQFAVSLADALLFVHYLAIILLEIRQLQAQYVVKITRSPDGEARSYTVGQLSIQRLAVWCLEQYYKDFDTYNPYLEQIARRPPKMPQFKFYDVDGLTSNTPASSSRAIFAAAARRRDSSHNDRFYEEMEYERRVKKRRARLQVAAEEAFTHIKRQQEEQGPAIPMNPEEAAQAVFPSMARAMQKYLRITRQQPRYTMESILGHLSVCIGHDLGPKAFLERYMTQGTCIENEKDYRPTQTWTLVCEHLLSRAVEHGTLFQLKQGDVSILVQVRKLPHFNLTEEVVDPKNNKFVLRLQSETSV